ncbi:MAG: alpha/beta hydrolase [Bacteroidota bacterium]
MTANKRFRFKKRYLLLGLFIALLSVLHSGCFSLRQSNASFAKKLENRGQQDYQFHSYEVGERQMNYVQVGEGAGRPLVLFLHGSPGAADAYLEYLVKPELNEKAVLASVDRPGFGHSDFGKTEKSLAQQAAYIRPIIDRIQPSKTILCGHSFGGPVAARMAIDFPDLIDGIILVAPSIDPELEPGTWWRKIFNVPILRLLVPTALRVCNQEIIPLKKELEIMLPGWEQIEAEATIFQGEKDRLVPAGNADFAHKMLTNSPAVDMHMIPGGNHFILWSEVDQITAAILKMLD